MLQKVGPVVLGQRIRRRRIVKGISIRDLADRANVSKTSVVRLESGMPCHGTTIAKVCAGIGLHLDRFLDPGEEEFASVHRHKDDQWYDLIKFADGPIERANDPEYRKKIAAKGVAPLLLFKNALSNGQIFSAVVELHRESPARSHPGEEWVYVLTGSAVIRVGQQTYTVSEGECMNFWSAEEHTYAPAPGYELPVRILSVTVGEGSRS